MSAQSRGKAWPARVQLILGMATFGSATPVSKVVAG